MRKKAFTLIELLIAMALLAVLAMLLIGNFNTTLKRGRDAQRKNDLNQFQKALELYYEDNKAYPVFATSDIFNKVMCGVNTVQTNTAACGTDTIYMIKTPKDPNSAYTYKYVSDGKYYYLFSYIENTLDQNAGVSMTGYAITPDAYCDPGDTLLCRYYVSSSNAVPLTAK